MASGQNSFVLAPDSEGIEAVNTQHLETSPPQDGRVVVSNDGYQEDHAEEEEPLSDDRD